MQLLKVCHAHKGKTTLAYWFIFNLCGCVYIEKTFLWSAISFVTWHSLPEQSTMSNTAKQMPLKIMAIQKEGCLRLFVCFFVFWGAIIHIVQVKLLLFIHCESPRTRKAIKITQKFGTKPSLILFPPKKKFVIYPALRVLGKTSRTEPFLKHVYYKRDVIKIIVCLKSIFGHHPTEHFSEIKVTLTCSSLLPSAASLSLIKSFKWATSSCICVSCSVISENLISVPVSTDGEPGAWDKERIY